MKNISYEEIGILAKDYFLAEIERVNAKIQRAKAREGHHCDGVENGGTPCYYDQQLTKADWCDNCKYVQPFHLTYVEAGKKARLARYKMTRRIKAMIQSEVQP